MVDAHRRAGVVPESPEVRFALHERLDVVRVARDLPGIGLLELQEQLEELRDLCGILLGDVVVMKMARSSLR
jgi:hypothetical protein